MKISSKELRKAWLDFYKSKGHVDIGAVSLIGDGNTGVMFNVAGMQPLMPYLLGKAHPKGTRLCNVQGCVRTVDIEEVGDAVHFTFFEMMGNWSLGDYFKKEKTAWSFEFLTKVVGFDKNKICATVFAGNNSVPKDDEAANYLVAAGVKRENIYYLPENWWELEGTVGTPCGPDSEWFYPRNDTPCSDHCDVTCDCGRWVEVGNDVYMQYQKLENGYTPLKNKNVDTGFGFERLLMYINGLTDGYKTDLFAGVIGYMESVLNLPYGKDDDITKSMRIIADHLRTSVMLIGDPNGILPSNVGAGYILRRLLRRAIRHSRKLGLETSDLLEICKIYIEDVYSEAYPLLVEKEDYILQSIQQEADKFAKTIAAGTKEFEKVVSGIARKNQFMTKNNPNYQPENVISGKQAFRLYETYGFPVEITKEMAAEKGLEVDMDGYNAAYAEHQELARTALKGENKGGLSSQGEAETAYHTATHIMLAGLRKMFGTSTVQKGSNITSERMRFDFNLDHKMTDAEIKQLEDFVNDAISRNLKVERLEMPYSKALSQGAYGIYNGLPDEVVSVYKIGDIDFQICGGPHVQSTGILGKFKITKEESCGSGTRRIKAVISTDFGE